MTNVKSLDVPPTVANYDDTLITNVASTTYLPGSPEVGVTFVAPTSGRVAITVGGGMRDNSANTVRIWMAPQVFAENSSGTEVLAPSVGPRGVGSLHETKEFMYVSRTSLLSGLTPGNVYYARIVYAMSSAPASPGTDIQGREIIVGPA
ncbi:hypothetical protein [Sphaerisporangium rhizosphaerae]|uniref:Fibronectin type-III domain-containing protein n=1 Tax=Sphaerisporangium rhizosphaerae TaxID=2269375 RepID=A0ABW2NU03_9ACTN